MYKHKAIAAMEARGLQLCLSPQVGDSLGYNCPRCVFMDAGIQRCSLAGERVRHKVTRTTGCNPCLAAYQIHKPKLIWWEEISHELPAE